MRSVVVVFPASMWAMMPMFRTRSRGVFRAISSQFSQQKCGATVRAGCAGLAPPTSGTFPDGDRLEQRSYLVRAKGLPPVVGERLVRLGHPVRVLFLLDRVAFALRRRDQLVGEPVGHRLLA